eukprot:g30077.t1
MPNIIGFLESNLAAMFVVFSFLALSDFRCYVFHSFRLKNFTCFDLEADPWLALLKDFEDEIQAKLRHSRMLWDAYVTHSYTLPKPIRTNTNNLALFRVIEQFDMTIQLSLADVCFDCLHHLKEDDGGPYNDDIPTMNGLYGNRCFACLIQPKYNNYIIHWRDIFNCMHPVFLDVDGNHRTLLWDEFDDVLSTHVDNGVPFEMMRTENEWGMQNAFRKSVSDHSDLDVWLAEFDLSMNYASSFSVSLRSTTRKPRPRLGNPS